MTAWGRKSVPAFGSREGEKTRPEEIKAFCKGKVGASIHPKHHRVAQFSNNPAVNLSAHCPP